MINFPLLRVPETTISNDELYRIAVPAVLGLLRDRGYTVDEGNAVETTDSYGSCEEYRIDPGPAALRVLTDGCGGVDFALEGDTFGLNACGNGEPDRVLWMQLVHLGCRFADAFNVASRVFDPDAAFAAKTPSQVPLDT